MGICPFQHILSNRWDVQGGSLPGPRAHRPLLPPRVRSRSSCGPWAAEGAAPRPALGPPEGRGHGPARPARSAPNLSPASARRKEAAAEEGAPGASGAPTCRRAPPGSPLPAPGRGGGRRPHPSAHAAATPPGPGPLGPPAPPRAPPPPQSLRGARPGARSLIAPRLPDGLAERAASEGRRRRRRSGRREGRRPPPGAGARVAPAPPRRGDSAGTARRGRRRMQAGCPGLGPRSRREGPACAPSRAAAAASVPRG